MEIIVVDDKQCTTGGPNESSSFDWERLPTIVYETLISKIDGITLRNLALAHPRIEARILEHFSVFKKPSRERIYYDYCLKDLDRSTMVKMLCSYDPFVWSRKLRSFREPVSVWSRSVTWELIFKNYQMYWFELTMGYGQWKRMRELEVKIRDEALCHRQARLKCSEHNLPSVRFVRPLGGRIMLNLTFPCHSTPLNPGNLVVVEDFENVQCGHSTTLCENATSDFQLRVAHFAFFDDDADGREAYAIPEVDRVILSLCNKCMTTTPMGGGQTTKIINMPQWEYDYSYIKMEPIFEVKDNLIVLWTHPEYLAFFLLVPSGNPPSPSNGYELFELYTMRFPEMQDVWWRVAMNRTRYLPVITEHKGETACLNEDGRTMLLKGGSQYSFHPREPIYYGLSLISPTHVVESFKPSELPSPPSTLVSSWEPQSYPNQAKRFLEEMQQPKLSAKGFGLFVFATDSVIAISRDGITWLFSRLYFPSNFPNEVKKIEVVQENGLMLVFEDRIVLEEVTIKNPSKSILKNSKVEPELELKIARIFLMDFKRVPWNVEISYVEINFDCGSPFIFIIADRKPIKIKLKQNPDPECEDYSELLGLSLSLESSEFIDEFRMMLNRVEFD